MQGGSQAVAAAAEDLSRRTEQQAASLEETSATLDQVTETVLKAAQGANHARAVATAADEDAKKSALVVRQAVEAMDAIAKSARQITQIIGVIDEIAFQTNCAPALQRRGEPRGRATRAAALRWWLPKCGRWRSARRRRPRRSRADFASTTQVAGGVALVAETGRSLERILAQMSEISSAVHQMAAGTQEQATALQQVNVAIDQMNRVTQENAAMVEGPDRRRPLAVGRSDQACRI